MLALIQQGFLLDAVCALNGLTALHVAAQHGHLEVVEALVEKGANVDATTPSGNTPLMLAAVNGHVEVAKWLLAAHASVHAANSNGYTALYAAVDRDSVAMMELLLDAGADKNAVSRLGVTPLHLASQNGRLQAVSVLVARGVAVDLPDSNYGRTALQYAAQAGHVEVVQQLVQGGAAVDAVDEYGGTALHIASAVGQEQVVELLLGSGADPSIRDNEGWLALHWACQEGFADVVGHLLQAVPGHVHATAHQGWAPLHWACGSGHMDMIQLLLAAGADPGAATLDGMTGLHRAAAKGHDHILQQLLAAMAAGQGSGSVDAEWRGMTALHCAVQCRKCSCVEVLLGAGADPDKLYGAGPPNIHSLSGATALHKAIELDCAAAVRLLATPANMRRLWEGKTPLHQVLAEFIDVNPEDWLESPLGQIDYGMLRALLDAGSPAGLPDADGNTAMALAAGSGALFLQELVPAMVRNECRRCKQQQQQQQGLQQRDSFDIREGIVDGVYALLQAAAAAAAADPQDPPDHVLACFDVVMEELGAAEARRLFHALLLRAVGSGEAAPGSPFHLLVYGLLHSGGWAEVEQQVMQRRWGAASRIQRLLGQPSPGAELVPHSDQAVDSNELTAEQLQHNVVLFMAAAGVAEDQEHMEQLLDQLAVIMMAATLTEQPQGTGREGPQDMASVWAALRNKWRWQQQQVLSRSQQEVADAVLGAVMTWEQTGGRGHG
jgi:ankyrin repeat protein